jgi:hypothetical protein
LYNLIIGKQPLHGIGAVLDFKERTITIDEIFLPMRNINNLQLKPSISRALKLNSSFAQEPASTHNATKRVMEILGAKYDKTDLPGIVKNNCTHFSMPHHNSLLALLLNFEELFDGTLGDWKLPPVSFDLKEGAKPYYGKPYPIPKIHEATLMKEIDRLVLIGVLKWQPWSKWALPSFIIPKKDYTVRTISDFRELNKQIVRKPYPIPIKISTTLHELECFTYATILDLNMGYYTIRLDSTAAEMCIIIFPWGKYFYQRLPMGFDESADIFQAEMGNLMATLKYVRVYIDNLLVIIKGSLDDHLDILKHVFIRLHNAGLKVNIKLCFCAQETEYLGYILSRGENKPQPKKVQAILALNPPNNVKELQ